MFRFDEKVKRVELGVHDLIEAGPPTGDLRMKVAWSARTRMRQGQLIHSQYQQQQSEVDSSFQKEISICHIVIIRGWEVVIRGRIDGIREEKDAIILEEIKSSTLPESHLSQLCIDDLPHWRRQVELYLYFLYAQGKEARGRLVLISIPDGSTHKLDVPFQPQIEFYIEEQLSWILYEYERRVAWLNKRAEILEDGLPFAHADWRPGQRRMAEELLEGFTQQRQLLMSAPTGYGKTAAALYAALVFAYQSGKKVFFASSRNTQQRMAEETIEEMARKGMPVRAVSIRARDRICLNEKVVCHPEHCHYSAGYHDKVRQHDLLDIGWKTPKANGAIWPDKVVEIAEEHYICPFAYSLEMAQQADVVIGDYNYAFDPYIRLAMISNAPKDWIIIVDEAHNLPDRAMSYASPSISLLWAWKALQKTHNTRFSQPIKAIIDLLLHGLKALPSIGELAAELSDGVERKAVGKIAKDIEEIALDYALLQLDKPFFPDEEDAWLLTARSFLRFHAALERASKESIVLWRKGYIDRRRSLPSQMKATLFVGPPIVKSEETGIQILCRDPSNLLAAVFDKVPASLCMSATLHPFAFYRDMLGLQEERCLMINYRSTFPSENRAAYILPQVSTAYRDRERDRGRTAALISQAVLATPGNTAVFFPSFAFRDAVLPLLDFGERSLLLQQPRMNTFARMRLLSQLRKGNGDVLLGVMGGIFSEGIDLPSDALLCAVLVGPSLPQANLARKMIASWYEEKYGQGFRYGWLIPGMSRVAQAAGRVIRGPEERGTVVLIGRRFLRREYRGFLESTWEPVKSMDIDADLRAFWGYTA